MTKLYSCEFSFVVGGGVAVYDGYRMVDAGIDIGRGVVNLVRFGRVTATAASASSVAWAGISTVAGGLSVAGVVFDAVALPFDFFVIAKGAYDIHKYRTGQGTNSRKALELEAMIKQLEEDRERILKLKKNLEPSTSSTLLHSSSSSSSIPSSEE